MYLSGRGQSSQSGVCRVEIMLGSGGMNLFKSLGNLIFRPFRSRLYLNSIDLKSNLNKAVFITGCDSGIGFNFALHLKSIGIKVVAGVHDSSSAGAVILRGNEIETLQIDVTNTKSIRNAFIEIDKFTEDNGYELCGLINNAGVMIMGEFEWLSDEMVQRQIAVNLIGPMQVIKVFLPVLRKHKSRIINVTSHCGGVALPGMAVYSSSKSGLRAFSSALRQELKKFSIPVIEFLPGSYITESCIMSQQKSLGEAMKEEMSVDIREIYGDYFERYMKYLASIPAPEKGMTPPIINDSGLFERLESALFSQFPKRMYVNQPPRYLLYYTLFSVLPECRLKDYLIKKFIMMPEWES